MLPTIDKQNIPHCRNSSKMHITKIHVRSLSWLDPCNRNWGLLSSFMGQNPMIY